VIGWNIGAMDMMIAAHAKSLKAVLVTNYDLKFDQDQMLYGIFGD